MAHFPQTNAFVRAPRVNFRRPLSIDFCLGQKNLVRGDLHVVSTTGGRAQTVKPVPEGCIAELRIGSEQGTIRGIAEMLPGRQTIHGWLQPFRFVALGDDDYDSLRKVVHTAAQA
jgi:hypothetical protein